jgi:hypothetical protein
MDCEYCAEMGVESEATVKCSECDEWICEIHARCRDSAHYICPDCCEAKIPGPDEELEKRNEAPG